MHKKKCSYKLPKYPQGGPVKPYIAKNQKDFEDRNKAYNDSLELYNDFVDDVKRAKEYGQKFIGIQKLDVGDYEGINQPKGFAKYTRPDNLQYANDYIPIYQKPVQKVIYQSKVKNKVDTTTVNTGSKPSSPIIPIKQTPVFKSDKKLYQGSKFTTKTGLKPGYYHPEEIGELPEYALGSTIGGVLGAGVGTLIAPGIGTGVGASLGMQLGNMYDESQLEDNTPIAQKGIMTSLDVSTTGSSNQLYTMGGYSNPNAEVELEEVAKTPNGDTIMFDGPSHANGGIQTYLPEGTEITSDRLIDPNTGKTFAKQQKSIEMNKNTQNKRLTLRPNDKFLNAGIGLSEGKSKAVFAKQEEVKEALQLMDSIKKFRLGGKTKMYPNGGYIDPITGEFLIDDFATDNPVGETSSITTNTGGFGNFMKDNSGAIGMGLSGLSTAGQLVESFFPDPINNIENPMREQALATVSGAINNQRGLTYDINDQLNDITNSEIGTNKAIDSNLGSGASRLGARLKNRSITLGARGSAYGERNRANVGIQSQANQMQEGLGRLQGQLGSEQAGYNAMTQDQKLKQKAKMRNIRYSSLSNAGDMFQQYGRDQELMDLLPSMFPNSGVAQKYKR